MKRLLVPLVFLLVFSCKKNNDTPPAPPPYKDSVRVAQSQGIFSIDLNRDSTKAVAFKWIHYQSMSGGPVHFDVFSLHTGAKIHALQGTQPICRDSQFVNNSFWIYSVKSCTGGSSQIRTDTFVYTPNLTKDALAATQVNPLPRDTFTVYKADQYSNPLPFPNAQSTFIEFGFFKAQKSGYMLFSVANKRYALLVRYKLPYLYFDELLSLD